MVRSWMRWNFCPLNALVQKPHVAAHSFIFAVTKIAQHFRKTTQQTKQSPARDGRTSIHHTRPRIETMLL
jgi:hypothetical protein